MLSPFAVVPRASLRDRRLLIIEDESLVAQLIEDELLNAGAAIIGRKTTLGEALQAVRESAPGMVDAVVLDLNLNGALSQPVAAALIERGIPFVIATGYNDGRAIAGCDAPVVRKPFDGAILVSALSGLLQPGGSTAQHGQA